MHHDTILVIDFGSQYTQLIARRIRELGVYSEILPCTTPLATIAARRPKGLVLSGGPSSVYDEGAPSIDPAIYELGCPVLGICYGAQLTAKLLGGHVTAATHREYGRAEIAVERAEGVLAALPAGTVTSVWMSHGDHVERVPAGFVRTASSANCPWAAFHDDARRIYCLQFHPEVVHTPRGKEVIGAFVRGICQAAATWSMASFVDAAIANIRQQVGDRGKVIMGLSGGVDSSIAAALLHRAIGDRLVCIFVDNGLLRQGERHAVEATYRQHFPVDLRVVDATAAFLAALAGVADPEQKRKAIGRVFIEVFEQQARQIEGAAFLGQGTLYPDVIESVSFKGPSVVIKSHHNVGGLPERMKLALVEPLRELFKDEVRALGETLGVPREMVWRQPFPGPGLAVRCIGEITAPRLDVLRRADAIIEQEIRKAGLYDQIWQSFGVLLPVKSVGVMGDARTYEEVLSLRAVTSQDGMTADWVPLPYEVLGAISTRIINEVRGINRVLYDITSKPPGTIEWE